MSWEIFTREFVRTSEPKVTITNLGRMALNNGSTALIKAGKMEHVLLLWDKPASRVAIRPVAKGDIRAYRLNSYGPKGKSGVGFSAVTFLNHIKYDWSKTRSFATEWAENMLIFTIPQEYLKGKPDQPMLELEPKRKVRLED
jgi:hypothetical protein